MTYSPFHDPKFYVVILNVLISLATLITGRYFPGSADLVAAVIAGVQAISAVLLKGYFDADKITLAHQSLPRQIRPSVKGPQPK